MPRRHLLVTVVGWLLALALLAFIFLFRMPVNPALLFGLALICPLSLLLSMAPSGRDRVDDPRPAHVHARPTDGR